MTKVCSKCGVEKDISEYYTEGFTKSGIQKYRADCRACGKITKKKWRINNIELSNQRGRDSYKRNLETHKKCAKRAHERNRLKNENRKDLVTEKLCPSCGIIKQAAFFNKNSTSNSGLSCWCKVCRAKNLDKEVRDTYMKRYREENMEKEHLRNKIYRDENKERLLKRQREIDTKARNEISDIYVKRVLSQTIGGSRYDYEGTIIDLKRSSLKLKRAIISVRNDI